MPDPTAASYKPTRTNINPLPPDSFVGVCPRIRAAAFLVFTVVLCFFTFFLGMFLIIFSPIRRRPSHELIRGWAWLMYGVAGVRIVVEGEEHIDASEARLLAANHTSWFDPHAIWQAFPGQVRFVLKRELATLPFVGWYALFTRHYLIDRESARSAIENMRRAKYDAQVLGISTALFPEGTRSADGRLAELKAGAFQFALDAGMPVQPIAVLGSFAIWPRSGLAPRQAGTITVRYGPPIPTTGLKGSRGRRIIAERTRAALLALGVPDQPSA